MPVHFLGDTMLTAGAASRLVLLLIESGEHGLAARVGVAVDHLRPRVRLAARDRRAIASALERDCPDELSELRSAVTASPAREADRLPRPLTARP
jgi:hypothetical protein